MPVYTSSRPTSHDRKNHINKCSKRDKKKTTENIWKIQKKTIQKPRRDRWDMSLACKRAGEFKINKIFIYLGGVVFVFLWLLSASSLITAIERIGPGAEKPNGSLGLRAKKIYWRRLFAGKNWKLIDLSTVNSIHLAALDEWYRRFNLEIDRFIRFLNLNSSDS